MNCWHAGRSNNAAPLWCNTNERGMVMGNLLRSVRRKRARKISGRRYPATARTGRSAGETHRRSQSSRGGGRGDAVVKFLRRNIKFVAAGAIVLIAAIVCLILFTGGPKEVSSPQVVDATPGTSISVVTDYNQESYSYEDVDEDTLAGLAGTDEDLFTSDAEMEQALLEAEGLRIGVTVQDLKSDIDEALLGRMEALSAAAEQSKRIYRTYYYNAGGSSTQQLQDMRSLINNEVDVIIVGATDAQNYKMICYMAAEEGIPVVAYDAPLQEGYAINVVTDQQAWGKVYGEYVGQIMQEGNVLQVLGSAESAIDQQRAAGINAALAGNTALLPMNTVYAAWKKADAYAAVKVLLEGHADIDAVITEEGMAEGVLDAFIEAGVFPKVMCGDVTAGFIQKWYALKHSGLVIDTGEDDDKDDEAQPTPTPTVLIAPFGELNVCAQPAPLNAGAVAFEIAVRMAEGRTLKAQGETFTYSVQTLITGANLSEYYEAVKDLDSSALVSDVIAAEMLEGLFEPAADETPVAE